MKATSNSIWTPEDLDFGWAEAELPERPPPKGATTDDPTIRAGAVWELARHDEELVRASAAFSRQQPGSRRWLSNLDSAVEVIFQARPVGRYCTPEIFRFLISHDDLQSRRWGDLPKASRARFERMVVGAPIRHLQVKEILAISQIMSSGGAKVSRSRLHSIPGDAVVAPAADSFPFRAPPSTPITAEVEIQEAPDSRRRQVVAFEINWRAAVQDIQAALCKWAALRAKELGVNPRGKGQRVIADAKTVLDQIRICRHKACGGIWKTLPGNRISQRTFREAEMNLHFQRRVWLGGDHGLAQLRK